jgi:NAD(P)-dependent dehydrogenase (short-subunit alcohol dehydrogenase family)
MKDKKIVIIGGSSGIGAALKKMLQESGAEVITNSRSEDIASAAYFLLSDQSSWVTGQVLKVGGGMSVVK